ncbi:MAG: metallophosphoesterase [Tyzzerella sp.]|nr:metallophosphoesterase [Tyzzerella sp.]
MFKRKIKQVLYVLSAMLLFLSTVTLEVSAESEEPIYVISGSDFQHPNKGSFNADIVENILTAMKNDGITNPYGFLFAGDYGFTESDATPLQKRISQVLPDLKQKVYIQGNHDDLAATITNKDEPLAETGNNDPEAGKGPYGVFVINETDYPTQYYTGGFYDHLAKTEEEVKERTEATAALLEEYLNEKIKSNFTKPIFVVSHLPLHATQRTFQGMNGGGSESYSKAENPETCGLYAKALVDVLNTAGEKGLNIIFLFGHDHGWGLDSVVGGDCVCLEKGETLRYANGGTPDAPNVESATLNFTYMNAGYVGYYQYDTLSKSVSANDGALTMTVFKITEDNVEVLRYDENGKCDLARVAYTTCSPVDDEALGYTELLTLEEAGGSLEDVTTVKAKIGEGGTTIILNKTIEGAVSAAGYIVGTAAGVLLVIVVVIVSKKFKKAKGEN